MTPFSAVKLTGWLVSKLIDHGMPTTIIRESLPGLELELVGHDETQAFLTGELHAAGKAFGLSLGDWACLALGVVEQFPMLMADRVWLNVPVQTEVVFFASNLRKNKALQYIFKSYYYEN